MASLSGNAATVLAALRAGAGGIVIDDRDSQWRAVDATKARPADMSLHIFTGCLGALVKASLYVGLVLSGLAHGLVNVTEELT